MAGLCHTRLSPEPWQRCADVVAVVGAVVPLSHTEDVAELEGLAEVRWEPCA